jgi:hypothetical protein
MARFHRTLHEGRPILFVLDATLVKDGGRIPVYSASRRRRVDEDGGRQGRRGLRRDCR